MLFDRIEMEVMRHTSYNSKEKQTNIEISRLHTQTFRQTGGQEEITDIIILSYFEKSCKDL